MPDIILQILPDLTNDWVRQCSFVLCCRVQFSVLMHCDVVAARSGSGGLICGPGDRADCLCLFCWSGTGLVPHRILHIALLQHNVYILGAQCNTCAVLCLHWCYNEWCFPRGEDQQYIILELLQIECRKGAKKSRFPISWANSSSLYSAKFTENGIVHRETFICSEHIAVVYIVHCTALRLAPCHVCASPETWLPSV